MKTVVDIAGYSPGDSDVYRKVIAKKQLDKMPLHRKWFIDGRAEKDYDEYGKLREYKPIPGGVSMGIDRSALEKFFDRMQDFGKYSFNKSHAAAYAYVCYITAWFMYYYPVEFMAANLNFLEGEAKKVKTPRYINYCRSVLGIEILPPRLNVGEKNFVALPDGRIVYSLLVKGASENDIDNIIKERNENGEFETLMDFLVRCRNFLGKKTYEGLIGSGALSDFGVVKSVHLAVLDDFWDGPFKKAKDAEKRAIKSGKPFDFESVLRERMADFVFPQLTEFPSDIELRLEKSLLGVYLSDNPLYRFAYSIKTLSNFELDSISYEVDEDTGEIIVANKSIRNNQSIRFVGILTEIQELTTKKKTLMARLDIEDLTGSSSCLVWPDTYSTLKKNLAKDEIYLFTGYVMMKSDEAPTIVISNAEEMDSVVNDRVIISVSSPIEARGVIEQIKEDKFLQGQAPTYIKHNHNMMLLSKSYWTNPVYMKEKVKNVEIKIW